MQPWRTLRFITASSTTRPVVDRASPSPPTGPGAPDEIASGLPPGEAVWHRTLHRRLNSSSDLRSSDRHRQQTPRCETVALSWQHSPGLCGLPAAATGLFVPRQPGDLRYCESVAAGCLPLKGPGTTSTARYERNESGGKPRGHRLTIKLLVHSAWIRIVATILLTTRHVPLQSPLFQ